MIPLLEDWNTEDTKLENGDGNKILDAYDIVQEFLNSGPNDPYLIIGAPFGIGKSSLVRKIAYDLAKKNSAMKISIQITFLF